MAASYQNIASEYTEWLDTLGFSEGMIYDYKYRVRDFFEGLQAKGVSQITGLNQRHITTYFAYLEHRPNKRKQGALLSVSHLNHNF